MENIRQAVDRALQNQRGLKRTRAAGPLISQQRGSVAPSASFTEFPEVPLDSSHLRANRIISHVATDPLTRSFDMLRTQVLQLMDQKKWKILAVTSPTPACGKTVTALNLALSIARQPERQVLFLDLDVVRPMAATVLGFDFTINMRSILEGRATLRDAITSAYTGNEQILVVPCMPKIGSSELSSSRTMATMFQDIQSDFGSYVVIIDLPPILSGDDVIAILPYVDCTLLVVAVGTSTIAQIEESKKHLQSTEVVKVALNKVPETSAGYY